MRLRRSLGPSLRALLVHKVRAGLALASIAVGVAAVILTSAIGKGAEGEVLRGIEGMGTGLLVVRPAQVKRLVSRKAVQGSVRSLREADGDAISELAAVQAVVPVTEGALLVKLDGGSLMAKVVGTTPAFLNVKRFQLSEGRFFDDEDERARPAGGRDRREARGDSLPGPIGGGCHDSYPRRSLWVIGVLEAKGVQADGSDEDSQVLDPRADGAAPRLQLDLAQQCLRERARSREDGGGRGGDPRAPARASSVGAHREAGRLRGPEPGRSSCWRRRTWRTR